MHYEAEGGLTETYPYALADFHHDVSLRGHFNVHGASNNEHNCTHRQKHRHI